MVHDAWPHKALLYTEAGMGGSWETAAGWTYWNMLLDETNGPRHAGGLGGTNPVQLDTRTGEVTYTPSFHAFARFSRFIRPDADRLCQLWVQGQVIKHTAPPHAIVTMLF